MLQHTLLLTTLLAASVPTQTSLAWKFRPGESFQVEQHVVQSTALEIKNKPMQQKSDWKLISRWQVKEATAESARLLVTIESLTSKTSTGDGKAGVASKEDELWRGAEFSITVDPLGKLRDLKGDDELLKKLAGGSAQRLKIHRALKPPDYFQALFQDVLGPLPPRPVQKGDRWQSATSESMSIFGTLLHSTDFSYQGQVEGGELVETSTRTSYKAPRYAVENDVFRITKGEVKANEGKGTLLFDPTAGRVRRVHKALDIRGEMTIDTLTGMQRVEFTTKTEMEMRIEVK